MLFCSEVDCTVKFRKEMWDLIEALLVSKMFAARQKNGVAIGHVG